MIMEIAITAMETMTMGIMAIMEMETIRAETGIVTEIHSLIDG
jgi:hypothetical protein